MEDARDNHIAELEAEIAELRRQLAQLQQQLDKFLQRGKKQSERPVTHNRTLTFTQKGR